MHYLDAMALLKRIAADAPSVLSDALAASGLDATSKREEGGEGKAPPRKRARPTDVRPESPHPGWTLGPHPGAELAGDAKAFASPSSRGFDSTKWRMRHVALQVAYVGAGYHGYVSQEAGGGEVGLGDLALGAGAGAAPKADATPHPLSIPPTVETMLFAALRKACLVENREGCGYTRCGRTDKGVSAAGQVLSIRLRSKAARWDAPEGHALTERARHSSSALEDLGVVPKGARGEGAAGAPPSLTGRPSEGLPTSWTRGDGLSNTGAPFPPPALEVDYAHSLNKLLPPEIRVMGWTDIPESFSARFSATIRGYRYFFPRRELDVGAMREAAGRMVGGHDFRNMCKIDIGNTQNFVREVLSMRIVRHDPGADGGSAPLSCTSATSTAGPRFSPVWRADVAAADAAADTAPSPTDVLYIEVVGRAFLWHQVRCMAALLLLVGRGMESVASVTDLLSPARTPARPQYVMAEEAPLLLHHCGFGEEELPEEEVVGGVEDGGEGASPGGEEGVEDPRRPARFLRSWPAVLPALRSSPIALRLVTLDLERAWAVHATAAAALRATIGRLGATRIGAAELAAVLTSEAARAEGRLEGTTGKRSAEGRTVVQPLPAAADGTVSWAEAVAAHGQALISLTDAEYPLHGGVPAYVPLAARCRGKGVEQRWAELGEGERFAITARHRVNAGALEAKVKARDAEPLGPTLPM